VNARIAAIVYAALTILAVTAAATAKGYVDSVADFTFVVAVSSLGLFIAHFWSQCLARRVTGGITKKWLRHEAIDSLAMVIPGAVLIVIADLLWLVTDAEDMAVTAAMSLLTLLLFAYTWLGTRALLWSLGTAAVGGLMIVFKVIA
jgi:hypothetical protein